VDRRGARIRELQETYGFLKTSFSSALKRFAFICDVVASATGRSFPFPLTLLIDLVSKTLLSSEEGRPVALATTSHINAKRLSADENEVFKNLRFPDSWSSRHNFLYHTPPHPSIELLSHGPPHNHSQWSIPYPPV